MNKYVKNVCFILLELIGLASFVYLLVGCITQMSYNPSLALPKASYFASNFLSGLLFSLAAIAFFHLVFKLGLKNFTFKKELKYHNVINVILVILCLAGLISLLSLTIYYTNAYKDTNIITTNFFGTVYLSSLLSIISTFSYLCLLLINKK